MQIGYGVGVQYYLGLTARAIGLPHEKRFKKLRLLDDVEKAVELLRPRAQKLGHLEQDMRDQVKTVVYP